MVGCFNRSVAVLLIGLACWLPAAPVCRAEAQPADKAPDYTLETIIVTGKRTAEDSETTKKASINVKEKIDAGQINSVTDILRDVAGFAVQFSAQSGTQVTLRGLSGERFLVAVNGNVLQNQGGLMRGRGLEWDMIPVNNVQRIEIVRGASNAAYAGTWGGVVNIVTVQQPGENRTDLKLSYGDFETRKVMISNQGATADGKFSWTVSGNRNETDGFYRNNWGDGKDLNLNLGYKIGKERNLQFAFTTSRRQEGIITGNNPASTNGYDPSYPAVPNAPSNWLDGSYRNWRTNNYSLNYNTRSSRLTLYQNDQFRDEWVRTAAVPALTKSWESNLVNRGFNWQQTLERDKHRITYGLQYQHMDYELLSSSSELKTSFPGAFVQDNWQLRPDLILGLGLRYDYYKLDMRVYNPSLAQKPRQDDDSQLSPKLSLTKRISDKEAIYASASSVFRPPPAADYYRWSGNYFDWTAGSNPRKAAAALGIATQDEWQRRVGVLRPENGWSYELGWRKQASERFGWRITGYYNDIDNYVTTFMPSYITGYPPTYNIGNAKIRGVELSTDYVISKTTTAILAFTRQKGRKSGDPLDSDAALTSIPENTMVLGLRYRNGQFRAALDTRYTGVRKVSGSRLGGYALTDLSFMKEFKDYAVALSIKNIFAKEYQENQGYPMPGRVYGISWQHKL
jgi:outer membrane receptor protein involved in Fe transport